LQIFVELDEVFRRLPPDAVAVEGVFTHKNARSALILGHARGVALVLAAKAGVQIFEYAPARVKRSVGAGGNDGKEAVARMVTALLRLPRPLERADAYDALAVALCHAGQLRAPVASARSRGRGAALPSSFASRLSPGFVAAASGERGP
jgi:crossover junction endodeoxyribonuclease RuvC